VTKTGARLTSLLMSTIESIVLNYRASLLLASSTLYPQPQERAGTCKKTNIMIVFYAITAFTSNHITLKHKQLIKEKQE
jgi:hypothetical protein